MGLATYVCMVNFNHLLYTIKEESYKPKIHNFLKQINSYTIIIISPDHHHHHHHHNNNNNNNKNQTSWGHCRTKTNHSFINRAYTYIEMRSM